MKPAGINYLIHNEQNMTLNELPTLPIGYILTLNALRLPNRNAVLRALSFALSSNVTPLTRKSKDRWNETSLLVFDRDSERLDYIP